MRLFHCSHCHSPVFFENTLCNQCQSQLGYDPAKGRMVAMTPANGHWRDPASGQAYRRCANGDQHEVCNWLVPADSPDAFCASCRLNRTVPDLSDPHNTELWHRLEIQKRRLIYSLNRFPLPCRPKQDDHDQNGLAFDFLADGNPVFNERERVITGHQDGLITLNIAEADPVVREATRHDMAEPYRTVLGHFRHESGHYYWDLLVRDSHWLPEVRNLFGDDSRDYQHALSQHYSSPPDPGWQQQFISHYAASHPWEDWAETWAHYLHMVDTLETAGQFNMMLSPRDPDRDTGERQFALFDPYDQDSLDPLLEHWVPLTLALNSLNRSMGHQDAYPFVLAPAVIDKLRLVHRIVRQSSKGST